MSRLQTPTTEAQTQAAGDNSTLIATDAFVTTAVANGVANVNAGDSVSYTSAAKLPNSPIYNNGASGVGATITTLTTNVALVVDGGTPTIGQEVLVKNEGDSGGLGALANGIYTLSTPASLGIAWVLTRATDYNTPAEINALGLIYTMGGTANAGVSYALVTRITTVGVDSITYQVGAPAANTLMVKSNNLSDVANATTSFTNIKQNATSSVTGVVELNTDLGGSATAPTVPALSNVVKYGSLTVEGHSYTAGTTQTDSGTSNVYQESNIAKLQSLLGIHEQNVIHLGQAGSRLTQLTNSIGSPFSGWSGVFQFVLPNNNFNINATNDTVISDPVVAVNGAFVIVQGVNDIYADTTSAQTLGVVAYKNALRGVVARMRSGAVYGSTVQASAIVWDSSIAFNGGHWSDNASVTQNTGPAYKSTSTNTDSFVITIPTNYVGGTVAINMIGQANGQTTVASMTSGAASMTVAANSQFPQSGTFVANIAADGSGGTREEVLVTSGAGTNTWTITRAQNSTLASAHTAAVVTVATDTALVTWTTNGSNAGITGTTSISGQGYFGSPVCVTKRFVLTSADAGKTITGTISGIVASDTSFKANFDSYSFEAPNAPPIVITYTQDWRFGEGSVVANPFIVAFNSAVDTVVAEFDSWVKVADVYTPFFNRNGVTTASMNNTDVSTAIGWTCNSSSFTPTVGMRMSFGAFGGEHCDVTAVSGSAPNWTLTLTRAVGGTSKTTHSSGTFLGPLQWMHTDDIHPTAQGHAVFAEIMYDAFKAMPTPSTYQTAENQGNYSQGSQSFQMGIVDNNWVSPPINGTAAGTTTQNRQSAFPVYIGKECLLIGMGTIPRASSTATMRYGIYLPDASHTRPGRLLQDFGATTYTTQTAFIQTGIYQVLRPGWYWLSAVNQSTAISMNIIAGNGLNWPALSSATTPSGNGVQTIQGYSQASISGALADWAVYTECGTGAGGALEILYQLRAKNFA